MLGRHVCGEDIYWEAAEWRGHHERLDANKEYARRTAAKEKSQNKQACFSTPDPKKEHEKSR